MQPSVTSTTSTGAQPRRSVHRREAARYLLRLADLSAADTSLAGAKAANLGELARAGFPVPDAFVVGTIAFDHFVAANDLDPNSPAEAVQAAPIPSDLAQAIRSAVIPLDGTPLAVRSSGAAEDLADASFAGQYQTFLDVRGADAVLDAVRRCWASAFASHVTAYRTRKAHGRSGSMAVLIQKMVPAEAAGVAFSANPVTGDRDEVVVNAVRGLGERLVSGQASPDEWVVRGEVAAARSAPEGAIDAAQAHGIAELARRAEAYFGAPQDVEWATAYGKTYLLQSRPITTLPAAAPMVPVPVDPPEGYWQREASHYPRPLSPMFRAIQIPSQNAAFKRSFAKSGALLENIEHREIGGWAYNRLVPLGGKDRPAPPAFLMPLIVRLMPEMRARAKQAREAIRTDAAFQSVERWQREWQPEFAQRVASLSAVDLASLTDEELAEHAERALALMGRGIDVHFALGADVIPMMADLAFACRDLLGWDDGKALELVSGLSFKSTEPAHKLALLAQMAREQPAVRALLEDLDDGTHERLAEVDAEFAGAFADYQRQYGCRALRYELSDPTVAESPTLILGLIRDQLSRDYDPEAEVAEVEERRQARIAEARGILAGRTPAERGRFERVLKRAEAAYPVREDNEFYTISAPLAVVRYAALEIGARLAARSLLEARDDVFYLEMPEALAALRERADRRALVAHRKGERAWVEAHPGPASYGKQPGPPPSLDALPAEMRLVMSQILWSVERVLGQGASARTQEAGRMLQGTPVSAGRYTGPVRVIRDESEFGKIRAGDVLVCPITSPVWSVLFPSIGALVTDTGGVLSHPAIIAREYRVPGVVATGNATELLRDGQVVTVDGTAGVVDIE